MSVKRKVVDKRLTLFRTCGICGKSFVTTADTPWVRQVPRDGKRQATTYYCSTTCYQASYKYKGWYDGKTEERRRELGKVVRHEGEQARVAVRNVRRDVNHEIKEALKKKTISEHEARRAEEDVQKLTDRYIGEIDKLIEKKEQELLQI